MHLRLNMDNQTVNIFRGTQVVRHSSPVLVTGVQNSQAVQVCSIVICVGDDVPGV